MAMVVLRNFARRGSRNLSSLRFHPGGSSFRTTILSLSLSIPLFFSLGSLVILGIYFFARRSPTRRLVGCAHNEITARVSCAKTRFYAQLLGRGQEYPRKIIPPSVILTHTRLKIVWLTSDDGTRVRERERERLFGYASNNPKQPCSLILHGFTKSVETTVSRFFFFLFLFRTWKSREKIKSSLSFF